MSATRRWRLLLGALCLVLAGVVGTVGWYKISGEPLLNFQVPLLASTGVAVMILAVIGGSLLVAEQLRTDDRRLDDLEAAMRQLADALGPRIELPPRVATGSGGDHPDTGAVREVDADLLDSVPTRRTRRSRVTS